MRQTLPTAGEAAIFRTDTNGSAPPDTAAETVAKTGSDWFPAAARTILGKDAGLHLHYLTGYPERSCYRYASGESPPPSDFLRKLFHSEQGRPFHEAFMSDCQAQWWLERQRYERMGVAADKARE